MSSRLLILGWHNIDPTPAFPARQGAGRQGFVRQLEMLARFANVVSLAEALDRLEAGEPLPPRAVALTFDDGYRDNLTLGVPALARYRLPATFFLVPDFLSGQVSAWWEGLASAFDRATATGVDWQGRRYELTTATQRRFVHDSLLGPLKRLDHEARQDAVRTLVEMLAPSVPAPVEGLFLDWEGARALKAAGHQIGSHSMTHAILAREHEARQAEELVDSRARLEARLGLTVDLFAYPNGTAGDYGEATIRQARQAGYRGAVTTRFGIASNRHSFYELRRYVIGPDTSLRGVAHDLWWMAREGLRTRWSPR